MELDDVDTYRICDKCGKVIRFSEWIEFDMICKECYLKEMVKSYKDNKNNGDDNIIYADR